jgi:hypothetical protein
MDITICISVLFLIFLSDIFSQLSGQPVSSIRIFIYAGCLMIFNNKNKLISQIGFYLNWIAMNLWKPKTRYNNEIFGIFLWLMAFISFASFKTTANKKGVEFEKYFKTSWEYWLSLFSLIAINLIIGKYLYKQKI